MKYKKIVPEVEIVYWNGQNINEVKELCGFVVTKDWPLQLTTNEGQFYPQTGDVIIRENNKIFSMNNVEFEITYEKSYTNKSKSLDFETYQREAVRTAIYGAGSKIIYPALGLANEAGEVLGKIKKVLRDKEGVFTEETNLEIGKEIGDVLWYIAALAKDLDLDLDIIAENNINKLRDRQARNVIQGSGDNR